MTRTCPYGGKVSYESENRAKRARESMGSHLNTQELRIYKCPYCFFFHFTSRKD